jgi:S1-C subfamily serine protease
MEPSKPLALPHDPPLIGRVLKGTAFFVDQSGHMLTARHAVEHCARIVISKEQHRTQARLLALSAKYDLALIKVSKTLGLAAVFPRAAAAGANEMVFADAYDALPRLRDTGVLANSRVQHDSSEPGHLIIDSPVTYGASGAPVLDKRGLVQGVISPGRGSTGFSPLALPRRRRSWQRTASTSSKTTGHKYRHSRRVPRAQLRFPRT